MPVILLALCVGGGGGGGGPHSSLPLVPAVVPAGEGGGHTNCVELWIWVVALTT